MNRIRRHRTPRSRLSNRRGVTLIELIVATVIISIGLLAVVGTSAAIARSMGQAREDNLAAVYAETRVENVAGTGCASLTLGTWVTATTRGVTEKYSVGNNGNNTLLLTDSLSWATRRSIRHLVYKTILPCRAND
jgi:prepilin-type N-terminal cleavage/methylation domain-containing protein